MAVIRDTQYYNSQQPFQWKLIKRGNASERIQEMNIKTNQFKPSIMRFEKSNNIIMSITIFGREITIIVRKKK